MFSSASRDVSIGARQARPITGTSGSHGCDGRYELERYPTVVYYLDSYQNPICGDFGRIFQSSSIIRGPQLKSRGTGTFPILRSFPVL